MKGVWQTFVVSSITESYIVMIFSSSIFSPSCFVLFQIASTTIVMYANSVIVPCSKLCWVMLQECFEIFPWLHSFLTCESESIVTYRPHQLLSAEDENHKPLTATFEARRCWVFDTEKLDFRWIMTWIHRLSVSLTVPLDVPLQSVVSMRTEAHDNLKLSNVTEKDAGKYWCRASNFVGKSENAFWLKIRKPGKSWTQGNVRLCHFNPVLSLLSAVGLLGLGLIDSLAG